jgi:YgiT-type zinc finger domain-containing protein
MKTCSMCDSKKPLRNERRTMKAPEFGLENVTLKNVPVSVCDDCGEEYVQYGNVAQLMETITRILIFKKDVITNKEAVFLRKQMGFSRTQLAAFLKFSYEHLNRLEAKGPITSHLDRELRLMAMHKVKCQPYELLDAVENDKLSDFKSLKFELMNDNNWTRAA